MKSLRRLHFRVMDSHEVRIAVDDLLARGLTYKRVREEIARRFHVSISTSSLQRYWNTTRSGRLSNN